VDNKEEEERWEEKLAQSNQDLSPQYRVSNSHFPTQFSTLFEERSSTPYPDLVELENISIIRNNYHKKWKTAKKKKMKECRDKSFNITNEQWIIIF